MTSLARQAAYPIEPVFIKRWSPRSFTDEAISDEVLFSGFEAARWAPSSFNLQPWRFIYAKKGTENFPRFISILVDVNRSWAQGASALIVIASRTHFERDGRLAPATTHSFDTGAAWSNFAHQLYLRGWHSHAMAGFDHAAARRVLQIPETYTLEAVVAVGKLGPREALPPKLQEREFPSDRLPLERLVSEGIFVES